LQQHSIKEIYRERASVFEARERENLLKYNQWAWARAGLILGSFALIIFIFSIHAIWGTVSTVICAIVTGLFINRHEKLKKHAKRFRYLSEINQNERLWLSQIREQGKTGTEYQDANHPYCNDLDLFGQKSVFQFIDRTSTGSGSDRLADWLLNQAETKTILKRQAAVSELASLLEFRQDFQLAGQKSNENPKDIQTLADWVQTAAVFSKSKWKLWLIRISPIIACTLIVISFIGIVHYIIPVAYIALQALFIKQHLKLVNQTHWSTSQKNKLIRKYVKLFQLIEKQDFRSPLLKTRMVHFKNHHFTVSKKMKQLAGLMENLDLRYNPLGHIPLNLIFFWDLHILHQLENWKHSVAKHLPEWLDTLTEMDVLNSLANLHFNYPDWVFPVIKNKGDFNVQIKSAGHFLIPQDKRVNNDFEINGRGNIMLITGSNMSGKSTYLRTIGLNLVLANTGAPVCAKSCQLSPLKLITGMRTFDSITQNESSFYAELKRLKFVLEFVKQNKNSLFLVDEILKGTNSKDRHTGSVALIRQLIKYKATGIVTTHDLELAEISDNNPHINNYSFEVEIENDVFHFDYKLKPGICHSMNATILMQKMGIEIN
jgi:DNA mismatch repair ATPase MutS